MPSEKSSSRHKGYSIVEEGVKLNQRLSLKEIEDEQKIWLEWFPFKNWKRRCQCSQRYNIYITSCILNAIWTNRHEFLKFSLQQVTIEALRWMSWKDKINIESTNDYKSWPILWMNWKEAAYQLLKCDFDRAIVCNTRTVSVHICSDHVQAAFDESLYISRREYDYTFLQSHLDPFWK